jgi:hypothetical protein
MTLAWVSVGVVLSIVSGVVRMRAWYWSVADAVPADGGAAPGAGIRYRDVVVAHLAGAGFNGLLPVHGGDAIKVGLLKRRRPEVPFSVILGSLAPPAAVEALCTSLLLVWALSIGVVDTDGPGQIPLPLVGGAAALAAGVLWLLARRTPRVLRGVRRGMEALRRPKLLITGVVPWIVAARVMRLGALACFLAAVGLPVTVAGALVVMTVQGGVGSFGPATTPMKVAVLTAALPAALGVAHVGFADAAALMAGYPLVVTGASLVVSVVFLGIALRTASPRRLLRHGREALQTLRSGEPAPSVPKQ